MQVIGFSIALFVGVLAVNGIRIDLPEISFDSRVLSDPVTLPNVTLNDPRCQYNGIYGNPNDCTKYYICKNGTAQDRPCPDGFKFDSIDHCTRKPNADCGKEAKEEFQTLLTGIICPEENYTFRYPGNCYRYIQCHAGVPQFYDCPYGQVFLPKGGCTPGDFCPPQESERVTGHVCEEDGLHPDPRECRKYIECINGEPRSRVCSRGQSFDRRTRSCTLSRFAHCRSNEIYEM